jgi:PQQ-dependent dehydrogenase (methanol/ethanol family)
MSKHQAVAGVVFALLALNSCSRQPKAAGEDQGDWLMYGRTYDDQRFSPLNQVNEQNVAKLGLAWSRELGTTRGLEGTPLVKDGVIFVTSTWSIVTALDAKTGEVRWTYDPKSARDRAFFLCCDAVNRGVALYNGKVYVGTTDARLIALDEHSGMPVWSASTTDGAPGNTNAYSITSAPRIVKGLVVIGNAGSEYGVRGFVSAYDAETGKMAWRSYTVPGDPSKGFESKAMETAAKTWNDDWWKAGGGGSPWEGTAYDPALDLIYFGTGNPTAWYRALRGPGDSLYTSSILAVHANNGEIAWHFQTSPGDSFDYDATQPLMQADLKINGQTRKVIMQANKNGFFFVLDRATGEFLAGGPFVTGITWATGLDPKTGRPIEVPGVKDLKPVLISPGPDGAHNWNPMAFSPATGLVYLPAKSGSQFLHAPDPKWKYNPDNTNLGLGSYDGSLSATLASSPPTVGALVAWDPVAEKAAWTATLPVAEGGGVLATAGNLVFEGRSDGILAAYRATDGKQLWAFDAGTGIMAPPVTYSVGGVQYVSVLAGWGGSTGVRNVPGAGPVKPGFGRIVTFMINGAATLKPPAFGHKEPPPMPAITTKFSPRVVSEGAGLFNADCSACHGTNAVAGSLPDLRYASKETLEGIDDIVLGGSRAAMGMPSFKKILTAGPVQAIRAYIVTRARESAQAAATPK